MTYIELKFVNEYLVDLNATQVAIRAVYSKKTSQMQSSRLLSNVMVQAKITELQSKVSKKLEITHEKVLNDLEEERKLAIKLKQLSAAVRASELQGKHIGTFTDKLDLKQDIKINVIDSYGDIEKDKK